MTELIPFPFRVQETSTAGFGGTGDVQLDGVPTTPLGRVSFSNGVGNGKIVRFLIDDGAGNWETSEGVVDDTGSPHTISRDTVIESSAGGAKVNFAAGVKDIVGIYVPTGLELIERLVAAGSSSLDFINGIVSTRDTYFLGITEWRPATDGASILFRTSADGGSTFRNTNEYTRAQLNITQAGTVTGNGGTGTTEIKIAPDGIGNLAIETFNGEIAFYAPGEANTGLRVDWVGNNRRAAGTFQKVIGSGEMTTPEAINAVQVKPSAGNITSAVVSLYVRRN